jgi:hypothetical protein
VKFQFKFYYTEERNFIVLFAQFDVQILRPLGNMQFPSRYYVNRSTNHLLLAKEIKYTDSPAHMQTDYIHKLLIRYELEGWGVWFLAGVPLDLHHL